MKKEKIRKVVDLIISIIVVAFLIWMYLDYEYFLNPGFLPSGKAGKAFIILANILDKIGGKYFTILVLSALILPFIYRSIKNLFNNT